MPLAKLIGEDGFPIIINPDHLIMATRGMIKGQNGIGGLQPAIGKVTLMMMFYPAPVVVQGTVDEIYGALRRPENDMLSRISTS